MKDIVNNSMNHELKLLRTNSLIDNDRISTNKFKIFFKTIMHNEHDEG